MVKKDVSQFPVIPRYANSLYHQQSVLDREAGFVRQRREMALRNRKQLQEKFNREYDRLINNADPKGMQGFRRQLHMFRKKQQRGEECW